jgi:hypothetical protein
MWLSALLHVMVYVSREMFNKWQAQRWWAENYDKVMELYNVQRFNQTVPLPTTPKSEDEVRRPLNLFICFLIIQGNNTPPPPPPPPVM